MVDLGVWAALKEGPLPLAEAGAKKRELISESLIQRQL